MMTPDDEALRRCMREFRRSLRKGVAPRLPKGVSLGQTERLMRTLNKEASDT